MSEQDFQDTIDTFLARKSPCTVCGEVAWQAGDIIGTPIAQNGKVGGLGAPKLVAQTFWCATCHHLVFIHLGTGARQSNVPQAES